MFIYFDSILYFGLYTVREKCYTKSTNKPIINF